MPYTPPNPKRLVNEVSSIVGGNRLEPRPRSREFNRSLRAEVRDAAWLLTRQWQLKEFRAEDRGMPVEAEVVLEVSRVNQVRLNTNAPVAFTQDRLPLPLDALVQGQAPVVDPGMRLQMGYYWVQLLRQAGLTSYVAPFQTGTYALDAQNDQTPGHLAEYGSEYALSEAHLLLRTLSGKAVDGYRVYEEVLPDANAVLAAAGAQNAPPAEQQQLREAASAFVAWFRRLYTQPTGANASAWSIPDVSYRFAAAAPTSGTSPLVLTAPEHDGQDMHWYSVDVAASAGGFQNTANVVQPVTQRFVPSEIEFAGAPSARWWEFEDGKVDFGKVTADPSDFGRMLLQEFMFLYQNDWFALPYTVPVGSVCTVKSLVVTDVFGQRYDIRAAGRSEQTEEDGTAIDTDWGRWSMYALSEESNRAMSEPRLFIPPTSLALQEGPDLEQVLLLREEATNMVWGVEQLVSDGLGRGTDGNAVAARVTEYLRRHAPAAATAATTSPYAYQLATSVAENWIPFVLTQTGQGVVQLEQGAMLRYVEGVNLPAADSVVQPRTTLLNLGAPTDNYIVREHRVPPAGIRVDGNYRRARWFDGRTVVWYARDRSPGRGNGSSGLAYDQLLPRTPRAEPARFGITAATFNAAGTRIERVRLSQLTALGAPIEPVQEKNRAQLLDMLIGQDELVVLGTGASVELVTLSSGLQFIQVAPVPASPPAQDTLGTLPVVP